MHSNIHWSIIYNSKDTEAIYVFIDRWIMNIWCTHTHTHTMEYCSAVVKIHSGRPWWFRGLSIYLEFGRPGFQSLSWEDPLEKEMATHYSTLAWRIPWREEPGRLQSMGLQRVRHDWVTSLQFTIVKMESCPLTQHEWVWWVLC